MSAPEKSREGGAARSSDRILDAAAELTRTRGLGGTTIAKVCQVSGLPVSSVYWHFADKDALFAELVRRGFARWLVRVPRWGEVTGSLGESVGSIVSSAAAGGDIPDFIRVGLQVALDVEEATAGARAAFLGVREQFRVMVSSWLQQLPNSALDEATADDVAVLAMAMSDGLGVACQVYEDFDPQPYVELFCAVIGHLEDPDLAAPEQPGP